ncbi:Atu2307/SP_0267 family LLM class monooxygenase [Gulosibacter sp. 10]|uniref:Atu2307/SP_0267 family LLM class monooxygenase n=1 Tax=Gulosibacter sp. 10 TaxID=1255570 RepID=UPI00097EC74C|nr:Atu2307/SP_0267 family LLM class monooxygenase [Gulosibacter sp. 10]SJM71246.1 putative oxidoreductase protein [Gulosibacter sp. 10]
MSSALQLGVDTFGDVAGRADGTEMTPAETLRAIVAEAELADRAGLDFFGIGEHHRADYAVSSPEMVLAAIGARTERIHVTSAVTVLSSDDPVRVLERFATLQGLTGGRAEIIVGRGAYTESFPLFGLPLSRYEELFEDRLDLFAKLLPGEPVTWSGTTRAPLEDQRVHPAVETPIPAWVAVGGTPESVVRAARHGLPVMLAIIGGPPARFAPFAELHRRSLAEHGHAPQPVGVHSPGYIAETDEQAREEFWPHFSEVMDRLGRERGFKGMSRERFDADATAGALMVGSPDSVARRIAENLRALGASRFSMKYSSGHMPHELAMKSIELYGREVAPRVRELLAEG